MFMSALSSDEGFLRIFLEKTPDAGADYTIKTVYRSKLENNLGETDLQVVYEAAGETHTILIENKIDATETAMQCERYRLRAQKGLERGEYSDYFSSLCFVQKYRTQNKGARKYDYSVSYEECPTILCWDKIFA